MGTGHIAYEQLRDLNQEVVIFILMGDFNYKGIDLVNNCCDNSFVDSAGYYCWNVLINVL